MIYVSQGHEKGIGLEIFLKSYLTLNQTEQKNFFLAVSEDTFKDHLNFLRLENKFFKSLNLHFFKESTGPQSTTSLEICLNKITEEDLLVTLPTSKDQLIYNNVNKSGYTEYFRSYFNNQNIAMVFKSFNENVLLLSDHIPLSEVSNYISEKNLTEKIELTIKSYNKYFKNIDEIYVAGINPHAGENGLLGQEEIKLRDALNKVKNKYSFFISDFLSGDTLHVYKNKNKEQLFVYPFHDQGLSRFKSENGFIGLNISFGLPFLRLSVDHGTAFNLYGKNTSNISGMIYLFKTALEVHKNVN